MKSDVELDSVRDSVRITPRLPFIPRVRAGKTAAEVLALAEKLFVVEGCGGLTMNMVLVGAEFAIARKENGARRVLRPVAGDRGRAATGSRSPRARQALRRDLAHVRGLPGVLRGRKDGPAARASAHDVHRAVSKGFTERGYHLGHVTGHSIGMTMIEHPKIGESIAIELAENMVFSMHRTRSPRMGANVLYMQDTWLVTAGGGEPLTDLPMRIFT